ncbi:MAG: hypothetical protein DYG88_11460 [Chloroflexi bacterium CFX4]|nr:hypothetical protein [Chloroflexi bacterium CFX4]
MNKASSFHVRHDLLPSHTVEIITLLRAVNRSEPLEKIQQVAQQHGYTIRNRKDWSKPLKSLEELGILSENKKHIGLTDIGRHIAALTVFQPDLLPDFVHFLYYTVYDDDKNKRFSWSYRLICDALWNSAPCVVNRDKLVNLVTAQALETFQVNGISFSTNSVYGILNWLSALRPACIAVQENKQRFVRRAYCSVEMFMLSLHYVLRRYQDKDNWFTSITPKLRQEVCRVCLIVPETFSEMLEQAEANFDCLQVRHERGDRIAIKDFSWSTLER